jgi:hypothetical protein
MGVVKLRPKAVQDLWQRQATASAIRIDRAQMIIAATRAGELLPRLAKTPANRAQHLRTTRTGTPLRASAKRIAGVSPSASGAWSKTWSRGRLARRRRKSSGPGC